MKRHNWHRVAAHGYLKYQCGDCGATRMRSYGAKIFNPAKLNGQKQQYCPCTTKKIANG